MGGTGSKQLQLITTESWVTQAREHIQSLVVIQCAQHGLNHSQT